MITFSFVCISFFCNFYTHSSLAESGDQEKIGVLINENKKEELFDENVEKGFETSRKKINDIFLLTFLNYETFKITKDTKLEDVKYKLIFYPQVQNLDEYQIDLLMEYINSGGKLVLSLGTEEISEQTKSFFKNLGFSINGYTSANKSLNLKHKDQELIFQLPIGKKFLDFEMSGKYIKAAARWDHGNLAIGKVNNVVLIGYDLCKLAETKSNADLIVKTINYYWEGINSSFEQKMSKEEFEKTLKEIITLKDRSSSVLRVAEELKISIPKFEINRHYEDGINYLKDYSSSYLFGDHTKSRRYAELAKNNFSISTSLAIPSNESEIRAVWLDRGTIVDCSGPGELNQIIKDIAHAGFNVVFFETINAGYPIYPSMLLTQNPQIKGWDPLSVAIKSAHENNIELHAWVWTFAVGNSRHNLLLDQDVSFPGPVLSTVGAGWELKSQDGSLKGMDQTEFWVSPANKNACEFLKSIFKEIVSNYDVDGFQFDYIRFPFQNRNFQAGYDAVSLGSYKSETGIGLDPGIFPNKNWVEWKSNKVSRFLSEASSELKQIKPELKTSVAVFATSREERLNAIQQDWETWAENNLVDAVYPFYYSFTPEDIKNRIKASREAIKYRSLIIPGFNLNILNDGELSEKIIATREVGALGLALFSSTHLSRDKRYLLKLGPFRNKAKSIPYDKPLDSCISLFLEFAKLIDVFTNSNTCSILSDAKTKEDVKKLTEELKNELQSYKPENNDYIESKFIELRNKIEEMLSLEKYLGRDERTQYIKSYFEQAYTMFNYLKTKNYVVSFSG